MGSIRPGLVLAATAVAVALLIGGEIRCVSAQRHISTLAADAVNIIHLPLDERFTTRFAFLNLATTTPFGVVTPPMSLLPHLKVFPPLDALHQWVDEHIAAANTMVFSSEMYLYGGLIASRSSNDTTETVLTRLNALIAYKSANPTLNCYLSAVVMRIPSYNEDVEEPWYWAYYGADLYTYSYYLDKFTRGGHNASDWQQAEAAKALVPPPIVNEFLWRRARNFNTTVALLEAQAQHALFERIWITLDDNALWGLNIAEATELRALVASLGLSDSVNIYPGADEVQLTMLSRVAVDNAGYSPRVQLVFRDPTTVQRVPNYEGQPMIDTLLAQLSAAGGTAINASSADEADEPADVVLCVNNFSEQTQIESPNQPSNGNVSEFAMFTPYVAAAMAAGGKPIIGFEDNRYSNGGDNWFGEYLLSLAPGGSAGLNPPLDMQWFAYAGWNTDGNSLGTSISNSLLLYRFRSGSANTRFVSLRILEDRWYQANFRQTLSNYVYGITAAYGNQPIENVENLVPDLAFYTRFIYKPLASSYIGIAQTWNLPWTLESVSYPWNRTFEIALFLNADQYESDLATPLLTLTQ